MILVVLLLINHDDIGWCKISTSISTLSLDSPRCSGWRLSTDGADESATTVLLDLPRASQWRLSEDALGTSSTSGGA
ncbi:hypothetical protein Tco_0506340 [Tanacetum coccineum]